MILFVICFIFFVSRCEWSCQYGYDERKTFQSTYDSIKPSSWVTELPYIDHRCRILIDTNGYVWAYTAKNMGGDIANRLDVESGKLLFSSPVPSHHHSKKYITLANDGTLLFYASQKQGVISRVDKEGVVGGWEMNTTLDEAMNMAFYSEYLLYQDSIETVQAVHYPSKKVQWTIETGSSQGTGPFTIFRDKLYFPTNGPPYYLFILDPISGKVLKKVEILKEENVFNAHMNPKLTFHEDSETIYYIANRGKVGNNTTSVLYGYDFVYTMKWNVSLTFPDLVKCADGVISDDNVIVPCWKKISENHTYTIIYILSFDGRIILKMNEIPGTCEKLALQSGEKGSFWLSCPDTIYKVDAISGTAKVFAQAEVVYEVDTDASGCLFYVIGNNSEKWVKLNRICES